MLRNGHVRFGGRVGETDRRQRRHRAPARPLPGRREVRVPELALDQRQRDPLVQQLDGVRMPQLMRRKPAPHASVNGERDAAPHALRWRTTRGRGSGRRSRRTARPAAASARSAVQSARTAHAHGSIPTSRRRSPFPCRMSRLPRRSLRSVSASERASWIRTPARHSTTIRPAHPPAVTSVSGLAHDRDDLIDRGRIRRIPAALVRWNPAGVMAGQCRRGPGTAGGVEQLMSRHGSLLWRADRLLPALTDPGRTPAGVHRALASSAAARLAARLRKPRNQPSSSSRAGMGSTVRLASVRTLKASDTQTAPNEVRRWRLESPISVFCGNSTDGRGVRGTEPRTPRAQS